MTLMHRERGMTAIGWLLMLALIAFFAILVLRLTPNYLEYFKVASSLESLAGEPGIGQKPPAEVRKLLLRRFDINDVEHVDKKDIKISRENGKMKVSVTYEVRVPILGNVDAVTSFNKEVEVRLH